VRSCRRRSTGSPRAASRPSRPPSTYETDPVGDVLDQPAFLNACLAVETDLNPDALLTAAKDVERAMGRVTSGPGYVHHGPRPIDIDVLLYDGRTHASDRPDRAASRPARAPLRPDPAAGDRLRADDARRDPLADALAALPVSEGVRRVGRLSGPPRRA